jgi:hypothetical protein
VLAIIGESAFCAKKDEIAQNFKFDGNLVGFYDIITNVLVGL